MGVKFYCNKIQKGENLLNNHIKELSQLTLVFTFQFSFYHLNFLFLRLSSKRAPSTLFSKRQLQSVQEIPEVNQDFRTGRRSGSVAISWLVIKMLSQTRRTSHSICIACSNTTHARLTCIR